MWRHLLCGAEKRKAYQAAKALAAAKAAMRLAAVSVYNYVVLPARNDRPVAEGSMHG